MHINTGSKDLYKPKSRKTAIYSGITAAVIVFILMPVYLLFFTGYINSYLENRILREFARQYPSYCLNISGLEYNIFKNKIDCKSLAFKTDSGFTCNIGTVTIRGIAWWHLILKRGNKKKAIFGSVADMRDIDMMFTHAGYALSCKRFFLSMPDGEIRADMLVLNPPVDDEKFFTLKQYRSTRFLLNIPELRLMGLVVPDVLSGRGCRARSVQISNPSFDALVDRYAPLDPRETHLRMPNEMMSKINKQIGIETLSIMNGKLKYGEIYAYGATPAVVIFDNLQINADGIYNYGTRRNSTVMHVQANFMQSGIMKLDIMLPLSSSKFSFKYSGSLGKMEINKLNPFLEHSEYIRVDSGVIETVAFDIRVNSGHATGTMKAVYKGLKISVLDKKTGSDKGIIKQAASLIMNQLKIRSENIAGNRIAYKMSKVEYTRQSTNSFIQFLWFSLRSGVLDVLFIK